jgi:hypothetical protein
MRPRTCCRRVLAAVVGLASVAAAQVPADAPAARAAKSETEQRAAEAIFVLRHPTWVTNADRWLMCIQELVDVGNPAVPLLVAELDRTRQPFQIAAMALALRDIGDARAAPALIHGLAKLPVGGVLVARPVDPALMAVA